MLKKIVAIMLVLAMVFSLAACGKTGETQLKVLPKTILGGEKRKVLSLTRQDRFKVSLDQNRHLLILTCIQSA